MTVEQTSAQGARRGRPRQPGMGQRVRAAAIEELLEGGVERFSVNRVARRAGVAKGTVLLRWPEPLDLVVDAISQMMDWEPVPDLGSLRAELLVVAERMEPAFSPPVYALNLHVIAKAAARPELWRHYVERIAGAGLSMAEPVFHRALARGEARPGLDVAAAVRLFVGCLRQTTEADPLMRPPDAAGRAVIVDLTVAACR
jgi:AcrR family transcriptional regulator